jgi:AraC family transcriptional regulator
MKQLVLPGNEAPSVALYTSDRPEPITRPPALSTHLLAIVLDASVSGEYRPPDGEARETPIEQGVTAFLEARRTWAWGWREGGLEFLCLYLPPLYLHRVAAKNGWDAYRVHVPTTFVAYDPAMAHLGRALAHELSTTEAPFRLLIGSLVETMTLRLLDAHSLSADPSVPSGPLSRTTLREVRAFVRKHLSDTLTVEDLAHHAGFSASHFSRLFKETTGLTPYQWVLNERVSEAKRRLQEDGQSIAAIAYATGFSSQSHLTRRFRKATGMTPAAYREAVT